MYGKKTFHKDMQIQLTQLLVCMAKAKWAYRQVEIKCLGKR